MHNQKRGLNQKNFEILSCFLSCFTIPRLPPLLCHLCLLPSLHLHSLFFTSPFFLLPHLTSLTDFKASNKHYAENSSSKTSNRKPLTLNEAYCLPLPESPLSSSSEHPANTPDRTPDTSKNYRSEWMLLQAVDQSPHP